MALVAQLTVDVIAHGSGRLEVSSAIYGQDEGHAETAVYAGLMDPASPTHLVLGGSSH